MAESIALGLRLGTTAEHANFAGIEGEITINETEKRAVVHDGTTKGGFPMARLDETGYTLTKSDDGTKLQLKNKAGVVLSETDAPSGGGGSADAIPKTGDRGILSGYSQYHEVMADGTAVAITIDKDSPDDISIIQKNGGTVSLTFEACPNGVQYVKNVLMSYNDKTTITATFNGMTMVDGFLSTYVNELKLEENPVRLIVVGDDDFTVVYEKPFIT